MSEARKVAFYSAWQKDADSKFLAGQKQAAEYFPITIVILLVILFAALSVLVYGSRGL